MNMIKAIAAAVGLPLALGAAAATPLACSVTANGAPPLVVELYTSEGCSSCPPVDRWLSTLKGRSDVLPLAFHVDYWDRLGWPDRFGSAEATARQYALAKARGRGSVYTPQVVAGGQDWRGWPRLPAHAAASPVRVTLVRDGERVSAEVQAGAGAPSRLEGYWAVLEDAHASRVSAGENAGTTLQHDHVVRLYRPVAAWAAGTTARAQIEVSRGVPAHPRRVAFVVSDAASGQPLQAAVLGC